MVLVELLTCVYCGQVVSLRTGDLTQEEVERLRSEGKLDDLLGEKVEGEVQGPKQRHEGW